MPGRRAELTMDYELSGQVTELETGVGVPGVVVLAFDKDHLLDDRLGRALTDVEGHYHLGFDCARFRAPFDRTPDLYVTVMTGAGRVLHTTEGVTRFDASPSEVIDVRIPAPILRSAGVEVPATVEVIDRRRLAVLACLDAADADDWLAATIRADLERCGAVLALMKHYMSAGAGDSDADALRLKKFAKLFELGRVPEGLVGHHYGLSLGGGVAEHGDLIDRVFEVAAGATRAWTAKSVTPMAEGDRRQVTGTAIPDDLQVYRGINHFGATEHAPVGVALLGLMGHLEEATTDEQLRYGHARRGGRFVAHRASSVHAGSPREVLRLNYRFAALRNHPPLRYLIEELVEIADGVYLGQQLLATRQLLRPYDPATLDHAQGYEHLGYFLLFDEDLNVAARRLFTELEMPLAAVTTRLSRPVEGARVPRPPAKFRTLTLAEGPADLDVLALVERDLIDAGSVLRMLKSYSDALTHTPKTDSPVFAKLGALFKAGIAPDRMNGCYDGALITWRSPGPLGAFGVNSLNLAWQLCRPFSPWIGQRFDPETATRLAELSDGHERVDVPHQLCANTLRFRGAPARAVGAVMKAMRLWIEDATDTERREHGYDAKAWFAIAEPAASVDPDHHGKRVYQLNYRWRRLRNPLPGSASIEELVQIADGLFLGQVNYATKPLVAWDPDADPAVYGYQPFGYFVLMDSEWQARRLRLGFDIHEA